MIGRKRRYLVFAVLLLMVGSIGCGKTEPLPETKIEEDIENEESSEFVEEVEDSGKEDFDSKNAYEYARLERILQELKRETDTAQ